MDQVINVTFFTTLKMTTIEKAENKDRTSGLDWIIPTVVNLVLIVITTVILVSLVHYGLTTGKWRGQSTNQVDKLNAGVVYTVLVVCAVFCIVRYIANQIYINAGFNSDENYFCKIAGNAIFISYVLILCSVFMFLWFRQKAFYTNNMLAFETTKSIRAFSYSSVLLIFLSALPYFFLTIIQNNYEASNSGCIYKKIDQDTPFGIYAIVLITFSHLILLLLFIYPVLQIKRNSNYSFFKELCCFNFVVLSKSNVNKNEIASNTVSSNNDSTTLASLNRVSSLAVRPPDDGIKLIIRKTLFFAVISILLDVILLLISYFIHLSAKNRRFLNMISDMATFCNLLLLILSFSTYKRMLMSCIRRK